MAEWEWGGGEASDGPALHARVTSGKVYVVWEESVGGVHTLKYLSTLKCTEGEGLPEQPGV